MPIFNKIKTGELDITEEKLLQIEAELAEPFVKTMFVDPKRDQLRSEKSVLQMKRQFILDRRGSWKSRIIWDMLVPITLAIVTAYITAKIAI